jgi:hypothetical protein
MNTNSSWRASRDNASAQAQFIEPTPAGRRKIIAMILGAVVAGLVIKLWLSPAYFGYIRGLPVCNQIPWLRNTLIVAMLGPLVVAAAWAVPTALKLLTHGQWPLPGTLVFVRTPIKRGRAASWRAYGMLAWSAFALMIPIYGWHMMAQTRIFSPPARCMPGAVHTGHPSTAGNASPLRRP